MSELKERADFGIIRYANCWEDADVLLEGLQLNPGASILSIASAGDNALALLATQPELLLAVDLSMVQLHLLELKKVAINQLEQEEFLAFIGVKDSVHRISVFNKLKLSMPSNARQYWEANTHSIEHGIIHCGKFEKYFKFFRRWMLPWVHAHNTKVELFRSKDAQEQAHFYHTTWNDFRWRWLFKFFFSKRVMGKYGRDPEFLNEVKIPVDEFIFKKAETHLISLNAQKNYFLKMIMLGTFGEPLPFYMRKENYQAIRQNLNQLKTYHGYAQEAFTQMPKIDACNLSNIFEYMSPEIFDSIAIQLASNTSEGCKMAYWNLMVPRRLSQHLPQKFEYQKSVSESLSVNDLGFFYNGFYLDQRI